MIVSKFINAKITRGNLYHYLKFGYDLKIGDELSFPVDKLTRCSRAKILVSCDVCGKQYVKMYGQYFKSHQNYEYDTCHKCSYEKVKKTNLKRYGSESPSGNIDIMNKIMKTNNDRYGGNAPCCNDKVLDKQRKTRIKRGLENPKHSISNDFKIYKQRVHTITQRLKKHILENWNGYDFYDGEYIKDNLTLNCHNRLYPTIDHKICISYGYDNNLPIEEITRLDNLVITKKWINCSKNNRDIKLFLETFNKVI